MGKANRSFARSTRLLKEMQDQLVLRVLVQVRQELDATVESAVKRILESQVGVPSAPLAHSLDSDFVLAGKPSDEGAHLLPKSSTHPEHETFVPQRQVFKKADLPENDIDQQPTQNQLEIEVAIEPSFGVAVAYFSTKLDQPWWRRMAWLLAGFCLVLFQICCITSVHFALSSPHCTSNEPCLEGFFCDRGPEDHIGRFLKSITLGCVLSGSGGFPCDLSEYGHSNMCEECAAAVRVSNTTDFCAAQPANPLCLPYGCYNPSKYGDSWDPTSFQSIAEKQVTQMHWSDWMSFLLSCAVVGMEIGLETSDVFACDFVARRGSTLVRVALRLLGIIRREVFVTWMALVVPFVVAILGASSLEIFFNTMAILFLLRVDDLLYDSLFSEEVRAEVERSGALCIEAVLFRKIERNKFGYIVAYSLTTSSTLYLISVYGLGGAFPLLFLGFAGFGFLGVKPQAIVESCWVGTCKYVAVVMIHFFIAIYVFWILINFWISF